MYLLTNSKVCFKYGDKLYFAAKSNAGSKYLTMLPSEIVNINFPPHFVHFPTKGGRRYFVLQPTHLKLALNIF